MRKILIAATLIVNGLLSGCNQLTQYTISEQEINQALRKCNHFAEDIGPKGITDTHIELQNLTSAVGYEEPGRITLTGAANVDLNSLFSTQKVTIDPKPKALPTSNGEKGAIFLQEMEVIDVKVVPGKLQSVIRVLLPYLNQSSHNCFSQQPAYVLRENISTDEVLARGCTKSIEVKPGGVVIPFTN